MSKEYKTKFVKKNDIVIESKKDISNKNILNINEIEVDKKLEKELKIKFYDLISFCDYKITNSSDENLSIKDNVYTFNIPMDLTYSKYKAAKITYDENGEKIVNELSSDYKNKKIIFEDNEIGEYAYYGLKKNIFLLPIVIILVLLGITFGAAYSAIPEFRDKINETFTDILKLDKPSAPTIKAEPTDWGTSSLVSVTKDAEVGGVGKLQYYEYCVRSDKKAEKCKWTQTFTKNAVITKNGIHNVWFRGISDRGTYGEPSNMVTVKIDTIAPIIENIEFSKITDSIIEFSFDSYDSLSGIKKFMYQINDGEIIDGNEKKYIFENLNENTEYTVTIYAVDNVGNMNKASIKIKTLTKEVIVEAKDEIEEIVDKSLEKPTYSVDPSNSVWSTYKFVTINYPKNATTKEYSVDGGTTWYTYNGPVIFTKNGNVIARCSNNENTIVGDTFEVLFIDPTIPIISLDNVPAIFEYTEGYKLPGKVKYGPSGGEVSCTVDGQKQSNTSTLKIGKHEIQCTAISGAGATSTITKVIEVTYMSGQDYVDGAWANLTLNYPEASTNRRWIIYEQNTVVEYDSYYYQWSEYIGPIKIRVEDIEKVVIEYDINGTTMSSSYSTDPYVVITPGSYSLSDGQTTLVSLIYGPNNYESLQYRFGTDSGWKDYNGPFTVGPNTIIEAKIVSKYDVFADDKKVGEKKLTSHHTAYISLDGSSLIGGQGGPGENNNEKNNYNITFDCPSVLDVGDIGTCKINFGKYLEGRSYKIDSIMNPSSSNYINYNDSDEFEVVAGDYIYAVGQYLDKDKNIITVTSTFRVNDGTNNNIRINVDNVNPLEGEKTSVNIYYADDLQNKMYRINGGAWQKYVGEFEVESGTFIEATGKLPGSGKTTYASKNVGKSIYELNINVSNPNPRLGEFANVTIDYNQYMTLRKYRINGGEWKNYTGTIKLAPNSTIEAWGKVNDHYDVFKYAVTGFTPYDPTYILRGPHISFVTDPQNKYQSEATVTTDKAARWIKYKIGNGSYQNYDYPIMLRKGTWICAKYQDEEYGITSQETCTYDMPPYEYDYGMPPILSYNLTPGRVSENGTLRKAAGVKVTLYPGGATDLQYSFNDVVWQDYTGPFDVYENCTIYMKGSNKYGMDKETFYIDYIGDVPPKYMGNVSNIRITASPNSKLSTVDEDGNTVLVSPESTTVTIDFDNEATEKYYRLGTSGTWKTYSEPFEVTENCTVFAYQVTPDGASSGNYLIDFLEGGYAEPIINAIPSNLTTTLVTVTIDYDSNAVRNTYSTDGKTFTDYVKPFDVTENSTTIYAKSEFADGTIKYATEIVGANISMAKGRIDSNSDAYYIIYLNYPETAYGPSRKYKYKKKGMSVAYKDSGIMLIREDKVSEVLDADGNAYMIDENGNKTLFGGDHYLLDVNLDQVWENIFMTWENGVIEPPIIIPDEETEWVPSVNVAISYHEEVITKQYKILHDGVSSSGWLTYTGPFSVTTNNSTIVARGINKAGAISEESIYEITNVDNGNPAVKYMRVKDITIDFITLLFAAEDVGDINTGIDYYEFSLDGTNWIKTSEPNYIFNNLATNASYTLYARAFDVAGNSTGTQSIVAKTKNLDKPEFSISPIASEWSSSKTITIEYMSGNYTNEYSLDNGITWNQYNSPITITHPSVIMARTTDGVNVSNADTITITRIDSTIPTNTITSTSALSSRISVNVNGVDNESGILRYYYSIDGSNYYSSFNDTYTFKNLDKNTTYTVYSYSENMAGLKSSIETTTQKTLEIDPPFFTQIDSYNDKDELMGANANNNSAVAMIDNIWSYYKKIVITYPYLDEDCRYQYALVDLKNLTNLVWKDAVVDPITHESTIDIVVDKEDMGVIARVVSGPNVVAANTLKLDMIDRTEPTIDLTGLPKSLEVGQSYKLPSNYAGDNTKSSATAECTVRGNVVTNTDELRSGMHPLICTVTTGAGHSVTITHTLPIYPSLTFDVESIIQGVKNAPITTEGDFYFQVETKNETIKYPVELWLYKGNTTFSDTEMKFCDDVEEKMCIIKVEGDLTIDAGMTVSPQVSKKGFLVYVTGKLINNGNISMSALGVTGAGENVYLYKSADNVYETVPAIGGTGAESAIAKNSTSVNGNIGVQTSKRATGGGGSGAAIISGNYTATSGAGATGTSYSGGSGGGAAVGTCNVVANAGQANASKGGLGARCGSMGYGIGGGVGHPTATSTPNVASASGAGGLLIVYASDFENNNTISANGVDSANLSGNNASGSLYATGGASGGGSVNIFYDNLTSKGTVTANGGKGGIASNASKTAIGGDGADGRVTFNTIVNDQILGSKTNPYKISTAQEFINIKNIISDYDSAYIELENDIDLAGLDFQSFGTNKNPFSANFDGKEHTVSNITIDESLNDNVGVFGLVSNGVIKNLTIANANITGKNNVGILAGSVYDESVIENIKTSGNVTGNDNVGGLVGYVFDSTNTLDIIDTLAETTINATGNNVGGSIGYLYGNNDSKINLTNSGTKATVKTTGNNVGGLIGLVENKSNYQLDISSSYSDGQVIGNDYVGGLVGKLTTGMTDGIKANKVLSGANVEGNDYVAGLIAYINNAVINDAYAVGNVKSNDYAGAFTGYVENSTIKNTYAIGTIDSELVKHVGGYAGVAVNTTALNSYFSSQTTKFMKTALGINLRIQKMLFKSSCYNDYNFGDVWGINEGNTLAYLDGLYIPTKVNKNYISYNTLAGNGTYDNPYLIYNSTDLIEINHELDAYYKMMDDVDLSGIDFDPIGQEEFIFTGTLLGNNHKITGLKIDKDKLKVKDNVGLFEVIKDATITDLTIENANVSGDNNVGILAGKIIGSTIIDNVSVSGTINQDSINNKILKVIPTMFTNPQNAATEISKKTNTDFNAWLDYLNKKTKIQPIEIIDNTVAAALNTSKNTTNNALYNNAGLQIYSGNVGGLAGLVELNTSDYISTITNIEANINVTTTGNNIGGVIGEVYLRHTVNNSVVLQNFNSTINMDPNTVSSYIGGSIGYLDNNTTQSISINSMISNGSISGVDYIGGIVSKVDNKVASHIYMSDLESNTNIDSIGKYSGGISGWLYNATTGIIDVDNVSNTGNVYSTNDYSGGLFGVTQNISTGTINISNAQSTGNVSGQNQVGGAIGYILSQNKGTTNISKALATGNVNATGIEIGGFVGRSSSNSTTKVNNIDKCYATGAVTGNTKVGGFVGLATYSIINDTFSTGAVNANDVVGSYIGEGSQTNINNAYSIGKITTSGTTVGGFAAKVTNVVANNVYFSSQTTIYIRTAVGMNNKIYKLLRENTYANYDFNDIWAIDEDNSTAYLQGLPKPNSVIKTNIMYNNMKGEGTESNPYIVSTPDDVNDIRNEASGYYIVVNDIDMAGYTIDGVNGMKPIGEEVAPFSGTIDGQGFTIKNYSYTGTEDNVGLFSLVTNGTIKNLNIENFDLSGKNNVGILAGNVSKGIVIENVNVTGTSTGTANNIGGLVGYINESITNENSIKDVTTNITVTGVEKVGGLIGYSNQTIASANLTIDNATTNGKIIGKKSLGGLIGHSLNTKQSNITIKNSENNNDIESILNATDSFGGYVGYMENQNLGKILFDNNINNGNIDISNSTTSNYSAGFIGILKNSNNGDLEFTNNTNNGDITAKDYAAGLIGYAIFTSSKLTISGYINNGQIQAQNNVGGTIGYLELNKSNATVDITNIENNALITANNNVGGMFGQILNRNSAIFTMDGLANKASLLTGNNSIGGLIGLAYNTSTGTYDVKNSYSLANINSVSDYAGGLIGQIYTSQTTSAQTISVDNSYSSGNITVTNGSYVGGLIGSLRSNAKQNASVTRSYATGDIRSINYSGGLIGQAQYVDIENTFATGSYENVTNNTTTIKKSDYIGGLIGASQNSKIRTSYAMGYLIANGNLLHGDTPMSDFDKYNTGLNVGSLVGYSDSTVVLDSYYSSEASGIVRGVNGVSRNIAEMLHKPNYNFDYTDIWAIDEGLSTPYLQGLARPNSVDAINYVQHHKLQGDGTETNPYLIYTLDDFNYIRYDMNAVYKLMDDIDLTVDSNGTKFLTIGEQKTPFSGILDGNNHKVYSGQVDSLDDANGIFASLKEATIKNLVVENVNYVDKTYVGGLASIVYENVNIDNVTINNNVFDIYGVYAGGLVGYISQIGEGNTNITNIEINSNVKGHESVNGVTGGEVGGQANATKDIGGEAGGLIGHVYDNGINNISIENIKINGVTNISVDETTKYTTKVTFGNRSIGGIIGKMVVDADSNIDITNIDMLGNVHGIISTTKSANNSSYNHNIGGVIGFNKTNSSMKLNIENVDISGAIVLDNVTITKAISAKANIGGVIGYQNTISTDSTNNSTIKINGASISGDLSLDPTLINQKGTTYYALTFEHNVGGVVGLYEATKPANMALENQGNLIITGCEVLSEIKQVSIDKNIGKVYSGTTGGFVGYVKSYSTKKFEINESYINKDVSGNDYVGGAIGRNEQLEVGTNRIELVYTTGNVSGNNYVGGLVGKSTGVVFNTFEINKTYTTGDVFGKQYVGGIAGQTENMEVSNSFTTGEASGENYVASFVGNTINTSIINCYGVGKVTSLQNTIGGFVSTADSSISKNSYFSSDSTVLFRTAIGTNVRLNKMIKRDPCYEQWNFDEIWSIDTGKSLAYLQELPIPDSVKASNYNITYYQGDGTELKSYEIYNIDDLNNMRVETKAYYKLMNDLDLDGETLYPIGEDNQIFSGIFDGQGYTIKNLNIDDTGFYNGLFGVVGDATIKNLNIENVSVNSTVEDTGALIGLDLGNTRIENINVTYSKISSTGTNTGGLIGRINDSNINETVIKNITIEPVNPSDVITGYGNIGGVVGYIENESEEINFANINIKDVNISGKVSKYLNIGGMIGSIKNISDASKIFVSNNNILTGNIKTLDSSLTESNTEINSGGLIGRIENQYGDIDIRETSSNMIINHDLSVTNSSGVKTTFNRTGGLIGYNLMTGYGNVTIDGIESNGDINVDPISTDVTRNTYTGGLIGMSESTSSGNFDLTNSYSTRDIKGISYIGGTIGYIYNKGTGSYTIDKVYSNGNIDATGDYIGGFIGFFNSNDNSDDVITKSFSDGNVSSLGNHVGGFAGQVIYGNINNCYTPGEVTGNDYVASFVGSTDYSTYNNVYALGKITSKGYYIGSMTSATNSDTFENAYFSSEITGYSASKAGINVRYEKLLHELTYHNFDFDNIWAIDEDLTTAYLQGMPKTSITKANFALLTGYGTQSTPYQIHDYIELQAISGELDAYYELANDIVIPDGVIISPFGTQEKPFTGRFNGNGYTIEGLKIDYSLEDAALFGFVQDSIIVNLKVKDADINSINDYVGVIAGRVVGNSTIERIELSGKVTSTGDYIGGLVGAVQAVEGVKINISEITSNVSMISGDNYVGGIIGKTNATLSGNIKIDAISINSNIQALSDYAGGLTAELSNTGLGTVEVFDNYIQGSVDSKNYSGGFAGKSGGNLSNPTLIDNITVDSHVYANNNYSGGLIGEGTYNTISNIAITGKVGSVNYSGGFAGKLSNSAVEYVYAYDHFLDYRTKYDSLIGDSINNYIDSAYYSSEINSVTSTIGTDVSINDLTSRSIYEGFDFTEVWNINDGSTMPYLSKYAASNNQYGNNQSNSVVYANSILEGINDDKLTTGIYTFIVNGISYPIHMYVFDDAQIWNENKSFGTNGDVGISNTGYANRMVVVKVKGDLTINNNVTVSPYYTTYGGPKGFTLYVTGTLTNNGKIDNSHGAYVPGENVYLWQNTNESYEYVPAVGATGGAIVQGPRGVCSCSSKGGNAGKNATGRGTGGGGSGSGYTCCNYYESKVGGTGTSYSGGTGSGRASACTNGGEASNIGGPGGSGCGGGVAGAGNPSGGTAGLLVLYADNYVNNGSITAQGSTSGNAGASGGGSINIFINNRIDFSQLNSDTNTLYNLIKGTISSAGGDGASLGGGNGGTGTINIGTIYDGDYKDLKPFIDLQKTEYIKVTEKIQNSKYSIMEYKKGYSTIKLEAIIPSIINIQYSLDDGKNWLDYDKEFTINDNSTLIYRGFNSNGDVTNILTYSPNEYIQEEAFDSDKKTKTTLSSNYEYRLDIDKSLLNTTLRMYFDGNISPNSYVVLYDENDEIIKKINKVYNETSLLISSNGHHVGIYTGDNDMNVSEINIRNYSILLSNYNSPKITVNQVGWYNTKVLTIDYPEIEGATYEYSINEGETWIEYTEPISTIENISLISRVMKNGELITSSVYNVSKIDRIEPSIDLDDVPDAFYNNYDYSLPSDYSFNGTLSGGTVECSIDGELFESTIGIPSGEKEIICTIASGANNIKTITKNVHVYDYNDIINQPLFNQIEYEHLPSGYATFKVSDGSEETDISAHVYTYDDDQIWNENMVFGDIDDVATSASDYAKNMVIVRVNGNLTIEENTLVTVYSESYGGPKGFYLYVSGELINKGTISMSAKGAQALGENIAIWKNSRGLVEVIPAVGAVGAKGTTSGGDKGVDGLAGSNGTNRATGGGGGGANTYSSYHSGTTLGGMGYAGTSYSGGAGGGGGNHGWDNTTTGNTIGGNCYGVNGENQCQTGVGITTGTVNGVGIKQTNLGTGGLLIIDAMSIKNEETGTINSNGVSPAQQSVYARHSFAYGGASGGGSINIFCKEIENTGTIEAIGGKGFMSYGEYTGRRSKSGDGGNGSVTITKLN